MPEAVKIRKFSLRIARTTTASATATGAALFYRQSKDQRNAFANTREVSAWLIVNRKDEDEDEDEAASSMVCMYVYMYVWTRLRISEGLVVGGRER